MCVECGCNTPVPFGIKVIRALAPGLLRPATVAAGGVERKQEDTARNDAAVSAPVRSLDLRVPLLAKNDRVAERNRGFFRGRGMLALNLVSSPGAGKTTLLGRTLDEFGREVRCAVVVGDLATDNDARRLARSHAPVVQITTGTACHLDAEMVARGIGSLDLEGVRVMFIENVGNLVCPAEFDLGEELRVVLLSTTEGEDKPLKYPPIFKSAHVVLLTKTDVAGALGFNREEAAENIRRIAPQAKLIQLSARSGEGMADWYALLRDRLSRP
ncbi:MAG: hydrogenase nickel incorporation protein HypB [Verrucomicrobia bacterium]|nr:hydrogenase nickel incorporation protein HypB [Verrucomicrobiota bacterium]